MAYLPKSKVNIKEASQGEFIFKKNKKPFSGKYLELSNGKYYAGVNTINLGEELVKAVEEPSNNQMGSNFDVKKYNILDSKKEKFLKNTKPLSTNKNTPTEQDYQRGYYTRYFAKRINQSKSYIEISLDTFKKLQEKTDYDHRLYIIGSVTWALKNGTRKTNNNNLKLLERTFPYISDFFPILNEFEVIDGPLNTTGGELYYEDGREYVGPYHVHPEKGPMVGAEHISEPHALLKYSDELSTPADDIEDAIPRTIPVDVNYEDFEKFQQAQREVQRTTRRATPRQAPPRPQMNRAASPVRRSSGRGRSSSGRGGY